MQGEQAAHRRVVIKQALENLKQKTVLKAVRRGSLLKRIADRMSGIR